MVLSGWSFLQRNNYHQEGWKISGSPCDDSESCGVICCMYAEFFANAGSRRSLLFDTRMDAINRHRLIIWRRLLGAAKNEQSLRRECGEKELRKGAPADKLVSVN